MILCRSSPAILKHEKAGSLLLFFSVSVRKTNLASREEWKIDNALADSVESCLGYKNGSQNIKYKWEMFIAIRTSQIFSSESGQLWYDSFLLGPTHRRERMHQVSISIASCIDLWL